ncbi:MAG: hypothetical protein NWF04_06670 [Candidatus Bathyarchaeota archaeon]|nr:hypothetical protein [Candidatus Bathyarchaeota archaeon]
MSEKKVGTNSGLTEESVVSKVSELMETLDQVKKYNALSSSLKKFALIVISSIIVFLAVGASIGFLNLAIPLDKPHIIIISVLSLFIPITGVAIGVLVVRKNVDSVRTGDWKEALSQGFPSALEILLDLDWDETFDKISRGRLSYAVYGLLKAVAYWVITFFAIGIAENFITFTLFHRIDVIGGPLLGLVSLLVVFLLLRNDLSRRYNQIRALDNLLWELRWFSNELRRAEF